MLLQNAPYLPSRLAPDIASDTPRRTHLIGIAGAGMRSLAGVLANAGWQLSGSDSGDLTGLPNAFGARPGHSAEYVHDQHELVVYSPAIAQDHVELAAARRRGIPTISYPEMLGRLMRARMGIAIAGTHGKSTVVAMVASIFRAAELDPLVICGAECSHYGRGPHMVAEACEYRSSFLHLKPHVACVLNIEPDHFDYFRSPDHLESEFLTFANGVRERGTLVAAADCPAAMRIARRNSRPWVSFGTGIAADWRATGPSPRHGYYHFCLEANNHAIAEVQLAVPGRHNMVNATAAAATAAVAGVPTEAIVTGLQRFTGLQRRLQTLGMAAGIWVIDDYAHHPTQINAAIEAVRVQHPETKITCVFEPHQASRTQSLRAELAASLQKADTLAVAEVYRAREPAWREGEITAEALAGEIRRGGVEVFDRHGFDEIGDWILDRIATGQLVEGDTILTLGAGRIGKLAHGVYQRIRTLCTHP